MTVRSLYDSRSPQLRGRSFAHISHTEIRRLRIFNRLFRYEGLTQLMLNIVVPLETMYMIIFLLLSYNAYILIVRSAVSDVSACQSELLAPFHIPQMISWLKIIRSCL